MTRAAVLPIVEGHGEQNSAIRTLLTRIWTEVLGAEYLHVLRPIRRPRSKLVQAGELARAIDFADLKIREAGLADPAFVLVLLDADDDAPCVLGPQLLREAQAARPDVDISIVFARTEFETWFVASAPSLASHFDFTLGPPPAADPESARQGKAAVSRWMNGRYGETVDQPRLTAAMDLALCRARSASFDKLCRELAIRADTAPG